jgi:hypothetical protein
LIEKNREDLVYGAIRRINHGLTQRVALDVPLIGTFTCLFISIAVAVLIFGIASTTSATVTRDLTISTVDELSIRSQLVSPYSASYMCVDERFKNIFD